MNYDVVATLGPSTDTQCMWDALLAAGASGFRLNTSHLSLEQLDDWIERMKVFVVATSPTPTLVLDLQGSKWRLGQMPACELAIGQRVELVFDTSSEQRGVLPVPHRDFFEAAEQSSGQVILNDAKLALVIEKTEPDSMQATVIRAGTLSSAKGITYSSSDYRHEALSDKDQAIIERTRGLDFVRYAISYVRDAAEMIRYRSRIGSDVQLIAKLERQTALDDAYEISALADGIWLCRGDLGAELGARAMAEAVHSFSSRVGQFMVPALLAGQVLEHMTESPTPTRSELCYLHEALYWGYQGVVLSDETAIGHHPVEACQAAATFRGEK